MSNLNVFNLFLDFLVLIIDIKKVKRQFSIIGDSKYINRAIEVACLVANTDLSVLITGENGVGKESFSKIIHFYSQRSSKKFIAINCGAIPEGTVDSELFGHKKGAFTGAADERKGYFEEADGGTIFLDEIGDLPLPSQTKLLRVLEQGEIIKVGSSKNQKVNVRVVAATNVNLQKKINEGKFREDLFYRLNVVPINIPPLRERGEDIYKLFLKFASDFSIKYNSAQIELDDDAKIELMRYDFPGNIRELKNITERLSIISEEKIITKDFLKEVLQKKESLLPSKIESENEKEIKMLYNAIIHLKNEIDNLKDFIFSQENLNDLNLNNSQKLLNSDTNKIEKSKLFNNFETKDVKKMLEKYSVEKSKK